MGFITSLKNKLNEVLRPVDVTEQVGKFANDTSKSIVKTEKVKFPEELGEEHPFDFEILEELYKTHPIVVGIIDKYIDYILGSGIRISSQNKKAEDIINIWMQDIDFNFYVKKWLKEALLKGTGFMELAGKELQQVKVLNSNYMYVKRDEKGNIKGFSQYIGDSKNIKKNNIVPFDPDEVAHLSINAIGDSEYGIGIIKPLIKTLNSLVMNKKNFNTLIERKANAPLHWKVGVLNSRDPKKSIWPQTATLNEIYNKLTNLKAKTEFVTGPDHEAKVVDFGNFSTNFEVALRNDFEELIYGSQIPEVLFGSGRIPEGLAKEQKRSFERRVQSLRLDTEKVIEQKIFRRILQLQGIDDHVEVYWGEPDQEEINKKIERIQELLKNPFLDPKLSYRLQQELVILFDFDENLLTNIPEATQQQKQAEREQEEQQNIPQVPGANRIKNQVETKINQQLEFGYIKDYDKDYSLKEWIGFNFLSFNEAILSSILKDKFENLLAKTQEQLEAGLFTTKQTEELRQVMQEGFEKELTIKELEKEINERVTPGNRYQLDKEGKLKTNKAGEKILAVSAKVRSNLIARTETIKFANLGALETYKSGGVEQYKWIAAASERTCPICQELDGRIFNVNEKILPPTESHMMCRCSVVPIVNLKTSPQIKELAKNQIFEITSSSLKHDCCEHSHKED